MFKKKKQEISEEEKSQMELFENAQKRIRQKKRLYIHFVIFLIGSVFLIITNIVLGIGTETKIAGLDWFVYAIFAWLFLFCFHVFNVFVTHKFMGKKWEETQMQKLVKKQHDRIEKMKDELKQEEMFKAQNEIYKDKQLKENPSKKAKGLTIIVAAGEDNAIGKDNDLIWHLSNDLKRFKALTSGHHIIMGRKTFESFPKPLPNRTHVVITRQKNYQVPKGVIVVNSLEAAIEKTKPDDQPFIIGGGEIYAQAMGVANFLELTRVHASFEGADTFFPEINKDHWREINNVFHKKDDKHDYEFSFITYEKI